jgi:F-type H+-transporting ATPase subunit alpha
VPAQIAVLLALTAELFDRVPLDQMTDAEHPDQKAKEDTKPEAKPKSKSNPESKPDELDSKNGKDTPPKASAETKSKPEAKLEAKTEITSNPGLEKKP